MAAVLYRLGRACARHHWIVIGLWLVLAVGVAGAAGSAGSKTSDNLSLPGTGSTQSQDLLSSKLPNQAYGSNPVVVHTDKGKLTDSAPKKAIEDTVTALGKVEGVIKATDPLKGSKNPALSKDKQSAYISVFLSEGPADLTEEEAQKVVDASKPARDAGLDTATGGYVGKAVSKPATESSEVVGLTAAVIILLFAFGTATAMALPIVTAVLGLVISLSAIGLMGHALEVPSVGATLATMIGLGVGIDYALFIVTRHKLQLADGMEMTESIARATATAGGAVAFAGGTVVIALVSLAFAGIPLVSALGYTAAVAVAVAVAAASTLLPALLGALGPRINSLRVKLGRTHPDDHEPHGWRRWATGVARRPATAIVVCVALLALLAAPVLNLHLGQADVGAAPKDTEQRQAYDLLTDGFGVGQNGPLLIAAKLGSPAKADQKNLDKLDDQQKQIDQQQQQAEQQAEAQGVPPDQAQQQSKQKTSSQQSKLDSQKKAAENPATDTRLTSLSDDVAKAPGIKSVSPPALDKKADTAVFTAIATTAPADRKTETTVRNLRDTTIPAAVKGTDVKAYVGGQTAGYIDLGDRIADKLPSMIAIVVGLSFIVLLLAFRSVLMPLKAGVGQPAVGGGGVRRGHLRLPGGPRRDPDRSGRRDPHRQLRAAADVRDPVRPVDGLRGVPADPDQGALHPVRRRAPGGDRRPGHDGACDHLGRADHGVRVQQLHPQRRPSGQAIRGRPGRGHRHRRDAGALPAGASDHGVARRGQLVAATLAIPGAARDLDRGRVVLRRA